MSDELNDEVLDAIFQKAFNSGNPHAILYVTGAFYDLGEMGKAEALRELLSVGFGIDVPPTPMPPGYRRATAKEITKPVLAFARKALEHAMPYGKQQIAVVTNPNKTKQTVMALTEHHLDNHPARPSQGYKAGEGPVFLHPGISMLVPNTNAIASATAIPLPKKLSPFPTQQQGLPTSNNEFAGIPDRGMTEDEFRRALWKPQTFLEKLFGIH
jgi:hypothetical protein